MQTSTSTAAMQFGEAMAWFYQDNMVPMIFEPYVHAVIDRVKTLRPLSVLELAAGTGAVTKSLILELPPDIEVIATDISSHMLDVARSLSIPRAKWLPADAHDLPFDDASFDVVVCQFGIMFFTDKAKALKEARRVLRPGGTLIFSTWSAIEDNDFVFTVNTAVGEFFPGQPLKFLSNVPHGYNDKARIELDLLKAGFASPPLFEKIKLMSTAPSPAFVANAYCRGTPLRYEIEERDAASMSDVINYAELAVANRFGRSSIAGQTVAHFVTIKR